MGEFTVAIKFPSLTDVINKAKTGIKNALPNSNPFLKASFLGAIATTIGGRVFDVFFNVENNVVPELFLTTAQDTENIDALNVPFSLERRAGTVSSGILIGTGTLTTVVPNGTTFQDSTGNIYTSTSDVTIISSGIVVTTLTQVGGIATAIATDHSFFSGLSVTISGANEAGYNGSFDILVVDKDTFTYVVDIGTPGTATGSILASSIQVNIPITSNEVGSDKNLSGGQTLTITTPIGGLNDDSFIQFPSSTEAQAL